MLYWIDGVLVVPQDNPDTIDYWVDGQPAISETAARIKVVAPLMSFKPNAE